VTDGQTDRIAMAKMCYSIIAAVARKSEACSRKHSLLLIGTLDAKSVKSNVHALTILRAV